MNDKPQAQLKRAMASGLSQHCKSFCGGKINKPMYGNPRLMSTTHYKWSMRHGGCGAPCCACVVAGNVPAYHPFHITNDARPTSRTVLCSTITVIDIYTLPTKMKIEDRHVIDCNYYKCVSLHTLYYDFVTRRNNRPVPYPAIERTILLTVTCHNSEISVF